MAHIHIHNASPADLKLSLGRMAPTSEQADLLALLVKTVSLLESSGLYEMMLSVEQPDEMGGGIWNWSVTFTHTGTPAG